MKDNNSCNKNDNDNANANDNNKPIYSTTKNKEREGLKSLLKPAPFDFLLRDQYKYKSSDGRHYILAQRVKCLDGIDRTYWSKCRSDNDVVREGRKGENNTTPSGIFNEISKRLRRL